MSFFEELKRRNVVRVSIAYIVASWLLVQVGDIARESFEAPAWVMKMVITALIAGFPIVAFFAWAYELTPEGIRKEKDVDRSQSVTPDTGRKLDLITIILVVVVGGMITLDRFVFERTEPVADLPAVSSTAATPPANEPAPEVVQSSIAVLPFVNMSNDPDQEYFSDGISEELLNLLVKVDGLTVASRTSSFAYKGSSNSIPQIASALKVANVLEGSVRKSGDRVRITAQLIDTTNDRHLWSDTYDRELVDIFVVQDEIASAIVAALRTELGLDLDEEEIQVVADTGDMDAYSLYLRGRELVLNRSQLPEATRILQQAVQIDPDFTRGWAMLGTAAFLVPAWEVLDDKDEASYLELSREANDRALELDPNLSLTWATQAMIAQYREGGPDWEAILEMLDKAIELDPRNASAWLWRGIRKSELGYQAEAAADIRQCLEIDPGYLNCRRFTAITSWLQGNGKEAIEHYYDLARSGYTVADGVYVSMFIQEGELLAALVGASYFGAAYPGFPTEEWISALEHPERDHTGSIPVALEWLKSSKVRPIGAAEVLMLAFRGYEYLEVDFSFVNNWIWFPASEDFKASPHFQRVINEMNIPQYWRQHGFPPGCRDESGEVICE